MRYLKLFLTFFKIGCISFGGGYGMILVMKQELIKKDLIKEDDFMESLVIAQSAPGPLAVNLSVVSAKHIAGNLGVIIATFGVILPSFIVIMLLSTIFSKIKDDERVIKFMQGTKPAVLALITMSFYDLFKRREKNLINIALIAITVVLTVFFKVHPIIILIAIGTIGYFLKQK